MSSIIVCGIDELHATAAKLRPTYVISLVAPRDQPETPDSVDSENHHRVEIDDVERPTAGQIHPDEGHIEGLIEFLRRCDPDEGLLIHCLAGISRSPAAALVALTLDSPGREEEAAAILRHQAPHVDPNPLILSLADTALGREGALLAARSSMGDGDWFVQMPYFELPRRLSTSSGGSRQQRRKKRA